MKDPQATAALLIFDLDGTLYCTESSFLPTMRRIYETFSVPRPDDTEIMSMVGETFPVFVDWLIVQGFPPDAARLAETIATLELEAIPKRGQLYKGVEDTLRTLAERGFRIALCTNGDERYAKAVLGSCGILHLFDALEVDRAGGGSKTDRVGKLVARFASPQAFVIGDRHHDIEAGRCNGCITIGAAYGYAAAGELDDADHLIEAFAEIPSIVSGDSNG